MKSKLATLMKNNNNKNSEIGFDKPVILGNMF